MIDGIINLDDFECWKVNCSYTIKQNNYDIKIIELITTQFYLVFKNKYIDFKINFY